MTNPEELARERASDVPDGAEVRADGSYVTPVGDLTEEQKLELLPPEELPAEQGALDSLPREHGTAVDAPQFADGAQ